MKNQLGIILNAHLPFVRHINYDRFLEEDWLFEAMNESYLPLLRMMNKLRDEGLEFHLTFSFSPTLCSMLNDKILNEKFINYLKLHIELGNKELERCFASNDTKVIPIIQLYLDNLNQNLFDFEKTYSCKIIEGYKKLEEQGFLELISTTATHSYLPIYKNYPVAVNAQIETGLLSHAYCFGKQPKGFWLPECGYYPGLEDNLRKQNISWMHLASQAFILSKDTVKRGNYAPVVCPNGVYGFARDYNLTSLVWSNTTGYPCDEDYREFYRDIGYDLPMDYIKPYIHEPEVRVFTGFKYWAITGNTDKKKIYNIDKAQEKVKLHAKNFMFNVRQKGDNISSKLDYDPYFVVSFDAELFGHWWYEGVSWLENVIRESNKDPQFVTLTPSTYLEKHNPVQTLQPAFSSWGEGGYNDVWVDSSRNAFLLRHAFSSVKRMQELAERFPNESSLKGRFLNQAARETLLLMASDWPFIIHNESNSGYALNRVTNHVKNLNLVYDNMCKNAVNTEWLVNAEKRDNIFKNIDYNIFNSSHLY
ncbi:MAG: 1,4-alpha-glucan branching protein domain-containing protein [Sphaerochaetaceae bacterium]